jgi:hypothetical protein
MRIYKRLLCKVGPSIAYYHREKKGVARGISTKGEGSNPLGFQNDDS